MWTTEQEDILAHSAEVPARVLAGPGTGKSATMVEWIGELLRKSPAPRARLLTFTRAATSELAKKISDHPAAAILRPSTIHSFAISVLLQNPDVGEFPEPLRIADDWEQRHIVDRTLARRIKVRPARIRNLFLELASNWEALEERIHPKVDARERARFVAGWQEHRRVFGYTLLAELPWALRRALRDHPDLAGVDYDVLVVDEYQDLNACDLALLRLLSQRGCCIIGVGDDDQSIYSFRRAHPAGIRRFLEDYPEAKHYPLSVTHRCGSRIMDWASFVIQQDLSRDADKPMPNPAPGSPPGEVALLSFAGQRAEPNGIAELVQHLIQDEEIPPDEILILLKSDHQGSFSKPIKDALANRHVPCSDPEAVKQILSEEPNRRLLASCRLLVDKSDSLAWATLLKLTPGIGDAFVDSVYELARSSQKQFGASLISAHEGSLENGPAASRNRAADLVESTLAWIDDHLLPDAPPENGWGHWICTLGDRRVAGPSSELTLLLHEVDELAEADIEFGRYLGQITPLVRDHAQAAGTGVRVMTMAASKGLTVEATVIASVEEGIIPSGRAESDRDEECRLLYVAMTRAKRFLFCTWARQRTGTTARAGQPRVGRLRNHSSLLEGGPVESQDGKEYMAKRWT